MVIQPPSTESGLARPPIPNAPKNEALQQWTEAARIGQSLLNVDRERAEQHFSFSLRTDDSIISRYSGALAQPTDGNITDDVIRNARNASFGITLEAARQIAENDLHRTGRVDDDLQNLGAFAQSMREGTQLAQSLQQTSPEDFASIGKEIIAAQLSKKPEEIQMDNQQVAEWINDKYTQANGKLGRQFQALEAYVNLRF